MKKLFAMAIIALSSSAHAEYIETPNYPAQQLQINESLGFVHARNDAVASSLETTYGFYDWLAGVIAINSGSGADMKYDYYTGADMTVQFNFIKNREVFPDTAFRLTYSYLSGGQSPDAISTMAVFEKKIGQVDGFLNIAAGKTIGDNAVGGAEFGVAAQAMYGLNNYTDNDKWAAGAEYFGDFGKTGAIQGFARKGQQTGPIIGFQPYGNFQTSINYLIGLTHDMPRNTITLELNLTF